MKRCTQCGEEYPATPEYFHVDKSHRDGLSSSCKPCHRESGRQYSRAHYEDRKDYIRQWREENHDRVIKRHNEWLATNPDRRKEHTRKYREANREYCREYNRKWAMENHEKQRECNRRFRQNPKNRIRDSISAGINIALKSGKNGKSWESLVGYTLNDLTNHLESQFSKGMAWNNYGAWHIDHIKPVSHFNFDSPEDQEFKECWSLWNLQPLWAFDNQSKGNRVDEVPLPLT